MKKMLLINFLFLFCIISKAQLMNPSLEASAPPLGNTVVPDSWSALGVGQGLINSSGNPLPGPPFTRPILDLFTSADADDLFWYFYSNTGGQFGGISQELQLLKSNTEYCFSFEAAVNRLTTPSTNIDFQLYFNGVLNDSETFYYPSETSSRRVELCFTTGMETTGTMALRTNNLVGASTAILIQAGTGEFSCDAEEDTGCVQTCADVKLKFTFDEYPEETSWSLIDANGTNMGSGGPYDLQAPNTNRTENLCLFDGCYYLLVSDSGANGMCEEESDGEFTIVPFSGGGKNTPDNSISSFGTGSDVTGISAADPITVSALACGKYEIKDANNAVLTSGGGDFGGSQTVSFCLTNGVGAIQQTPGNEYQKIATNDSATTMQVFPTLAYDQITVTYTMTERQTAQLTIFDINGTVIQQQDLNTDAANMQVDLRDLSAGMYFVQFISDGVMLTEKFIKQ